VLTVDLDRLQLEPGSRVLDLACGNGRHVLATRWLADVTAVALDLGLTEVRATAEFLEALDATVPEEGGSHPNAGPCCVVQGDTFRLPFSDSSFDCVVASELLEHLHQDREALVEISRVLRPAGLLAVSVPRYGPEAVCWALSKEYHSNEGGHIRIYRRRELRRKLEEQRFDIVAGHHAHALHSPYWWLRCLLGVRNEELAPVRWYHDLLVWDMTRRPWVTRLAERALDPVIGKSLVLYARKSE
jgi:SAM-dependent methyltransferase